VDFAGHCNQVDVSLKFIFSRTAMSVSMIAGEPKLPPLTWNEGGYNLGEDPGGYCIPLCLIR